MTDRDANRALALIAGIAALAGPRRTRPLAGFLYGLTLSRAQGASRRRLEATLVRLFDERQSVHRQLESHTAWHGEHDAEIEQRLESVERPVRSWLATDPLANL